jgi:hypothetical protein
MKNLKNKIFPFLIAFSALSVSASAAFYSVSGLSKLFAGASLEVIIMASSLEIAKLVIASLLYQYWDTINKGLRVYLTIAAGVLILITSAGIYGFLSAAYQETANKEGIVTQQITALETKKALYEETRDNLLADRKSNNELRGTLSKGSTTQYTDKKGNLVVRTNNAAIRNLESTAKENEKLAVKLDIVNDSIFALETQILETKVNSEAASELGPLKYLSELTGVEMSRIINWLLLIIIFVFDPLAIALVIAANFAFTKLRTTDPIIEDDFKDWDVTLNDGLEDLEWNNSTSPPENSPEDPKKDQPIPVFIDPKTGKLYYEEPESESTNLDLDGDGVIEEEEIQEIFNQADLNQDGIIDEFEALKFNLSPEQMVGLNEIQKIFDQIEKSNNQLIVGEPWKREQIKNEHTALKRAIIQSFLKKTTPKNNSEDSIKYF